MYIEQTIRNAVARESAETAAADSSTAAGGNSARRDYGTLPGGCLASLVFPYVPMQNDNAQRYDNRRALQQGTLFQALDMPFRYTGKTTALPESTLHELMALDFAVDDLGLYLTTHSGNRNALALYGSYIRAAREKRREYEATNGPLEQTTLTEDGFSWLNDPWPWEQGGNR